MCFTAIALAPNSWEHSLLARRSPGKKEIVTWKMQLATNFDVLDGIPGQTEVYWRVRSFRLWVYGIVCWCRCSFRAERRSCLQSRKNVDGEYSLSGLFFVWHPIFHSLLLRV